MTLQKIIQQYNHGRTNVKRINRLTTSGCVTSNGIVLKAEAVGFVNSVLSHGTESRVYSIDDFILVKGLKKIKVFDYSAVNRLWDLYFGVSV
ncbi:MAG: hypothetical protein A2Y87_12695 [Bacteroidetes bacterium RBG_13_46_8]|nr:MAG: hypothetical protein A2Y87_12695 [Bacteroidetes bacterium RBG_13_46_8]